MSRNLVDSKSSSKSTSTLVSQFLPSATKLRRLCFYRRVSVHRGEYLTRYTPWNQIDPPAGRPPGRYTPPQTRYTPLDQVHLPRPGTPPGRYTPQTRYTPHRTRYIPPAGTPPSGQVHPPDQVHPPTRCTSPDQVHTPGQVTPCTRYTPPEIRPLLRTVRILLECILVRIIIASSEKWLNIKL